jgi:hypothetical protein
VRNEFLYNAVHESFIQLVKCQNRKFLNLYFGDLVSHALTSDRSLSEWGKVRSDIVMASAFLEKIVHHCTMINIKDESYRMRDRKKNWLQGMRKRSEKAMKVIYKDGQFQTGNFAQTLLSVYRYVQEMVPFSVQL